MTECIAPPGPDDWVLMAYVEGDGEPATVDHLRRCAHCRTRAVKIAQSELRLSALLFRIECLSPDDLQDYHFGFMDTAASRAATAHMQRCPHCMRELATLARFLVDDVEELAPVSAAASIPAPGMIERLQLMIAHWLQGGPGALTPALSGLRGTDHGTARPILLTAGELQIGIDIQPDHRRPNRRELLGSVVGMDPADLSYSRWRVHLWRAGQLVAVATLNELGSFVLANLLPSEYELIIAGPGVAIDVAPLLVT